MSRSFDSMAFRWLFPLARSSSLRLRPRLSQVSGVRVQVIAAPSSITPRNLLECQSPSRIEYGFGYEIRVPPKFDSLVTFETSIWPSTDPSLPLAAENPWQVQRYLVGKASAGICDFS